MLAGLLKGKDEDLDREVFDKTQRHAGAVVMQLNALVCELVPGVGRMGAGGGCGEAQMLRHN